MQPEHDKRKEVNPLNDNLGLSRARHKEIFEFLEASEGEKVVVSGDKDGAYYGSLLLGGHFAAACDIGFLKEQSSTGEARNEDGFFKIETKDRAYLCVADGIGGAPAGEVASDTFLRVLTRNLEAGVVPQLAIRNAAKSLEYAHAFCRDSSHYKGEDTANMGLCFTLAEIKVENGHRAVKFYNCGDCRGVLITSDGKVKFSSNDQNEANKLKAKSTDPLFYELRDTVYGHVSLNNGCLDEKTFAELNESKWLRFKKGGKVVLASDGFLDFLEFGSNKELLALVKEAGKHKESLISLCQSAMDFTVESIKKGNLKRDNFVIAAVEI